MTDQNHIVTFVPGTDDARTEAANMELAKIVADCLHGAYPGYAWLVNADLRGGICNILCSDVSQQFGCTLMAADLVHSGEAKKLVLRAGGEILERANLHRGRMIEAEVANAKRDLRGDMIVQH